jgi:hypothetical protein
MKMAENAITKKAGDRRDEKSLPDAKTLASKPRNQSFRCEDED